MDVTRFIGAVLNHTEQYRDHAVLNIAITQSLNSFVW